MELFIKKSTLSAIVITFLAIRIQAQINRAPVCEDVNFNRAYYEISDMLGDKFPLSIKRAVFLIEWAYLDGKLDYNDYCNQIDSTAAAIVRFIEANNLDKIPTGKNVALFEYFTRPYSMNNNKPFTYDFNDIGATEDLVNYFVSKVMRTHSGQCRSLPLYYKILADELSAEAHITLAPQHLFIRHRHEKDPNQWRNVELTTQSLSREIFYIENFGITDEMIRNKVYMNPLSDRETVAYLLSELTLAYTRKYLVEDPFVSITSKESLRYFPQNVTAWINLCNSINTRIISRLKTNGNIIDEQVILLDEQWQESNAQFLKTGYKKISDETYLQLLKDAIQSMKAQGMSEEEIKEKTDKMIKTNNRTNIINTP